MSKYLTLSTCIAGIGDFVDPHTDVATLKQWIIEDLGGNFSFTLRGVIATVIGLKHILVFQQLTTTTSLGQYLQQFLRLWSTPSETICKTFKASQIARASELGSHDIRLPDSMLQLQATGELTENNCFVISSGILSRSKPL